MLRDLVILSGAFAVWGLPPTVKLNDGSEFPMVSQGTAGYDQSFVSDAMFTAAKQGLLAFDTAFNYYNQKGVGHGVQQIIRQTDYKRDDLYIITKISPCVHPSQPSYNITDPTSCYQHTMQDMLTDTRELQLDYVDMMLLHGPSHIGEGACDDLANELNIAQWKALQDFKKYGLAKSIGVSNFCISCLEALMNDPEVIVTPAVNQIQLHVGMGSDPDGIPSYCKQHGITVQAYSPLASGDLVDDVLLATIASNYDAYSPAQIALRWIVQQGLPLAAKVSDPEYVAEDIDIFQTALTQDDMDTLNAAVEPNGSASWGCSE